MSKLLILLLISCGPTVKRSYESKSYRNYCNQLCQDKFGQSVDWVGPMTGTCYCE